MEEKFTTEQMSWFSFVVEEIKKAKDDIPFLFHFSSCSRKLKKNSGLFFCGLECPQFSLTEITRIYLILYYSNISQKPIDELLLKLKVSADMQEIVTMNKGLSFFPFSGSLKSFAEEGLRSNMKEIFESVALNNMFPHLNFDENSWNQMVLKALFIDSPIYLIYGFQKRKNAELNRMVVDYALERIAASRDISPELWRCITVVENPIIIDYWLNQLAHGNELEKIAISLAWADQKFKDKKPFIEDLLRKIPMGNWENIGIELDKKRKGKL